MGELSFHITGAPRWKVDYKSQPDSILIGKIKIIQKYLYGTIDLLMGLTEVYNIKEESGNSNAELIVPFEYKNKKQ